MARGFIPVRLRSNRKLVSAFSFKIALVGFRGASHPNGDKSPRHNRLAPTGFLSNLNPKPPHHPLQRIRQLRQFMA